jgi:beta-galactosidase GanA
MSYSTARIVWEGRNFASGTYICRVLQDEDKASMLTIELEGATNHQIHKEPLTLKTDRSGGPELEVKAWQEMCERIIDQPRLRSSSTEFASPWFMQ